MISLIKSDLRFLFKQVKIIYIIFPPSDKYLIISVTKFVPHNLPSIPKMYNNNLWTNYSKVEGALKRNCSPWNYKGCVTGRYNWSRRIITWARYRRKDLRSRWTETRLSRDRTITKGCVTVSAGSLANRLDKTLFDEIMAGN